MALTDLGVREKSNSCMGTYPVNITSYLQLINYRGFKTFYLEIIIDRDLDTVKNNCTVHKLLSAFQVTYKFKLLSAF